jgi:hypothetical protein
MWEVAIRLHPPQKSNGPLTGDAGKINSALTAIMRGAIRDVESAGQHLESKIPDPAMASRELERAINVVRSLADTYKGAGDEYISEKLAAVHNRLLWFKIALDDHDPNKRMTLKQVAEATDPEKEPFKERIKKIEDELK